MPLVLALFLTARPVKERTKNMAQRVSRLVQVTLFSQALNVLTAIPDAPHAQDRPQIASPVNQHTRNTGLVV